MFNPIDTQNDTNATLNVIHASTTAAVIANISSQGVSINPNNGIKFPIILLLCLSFIFPAITSRINQIAIKINGKGTTFPGLGIHCVWSLFKTLSPVQVFKIGTQLS